MGEDSDLVIDVSVERLKEHCNPFTYFGIPRELVDEAIKKNHLSTLNHMDRAGLKSDHIVYNAERVAYFVVNGVTDYIEIDVGIPILNYCPEWMITDGNHRLMAAIYRKDEFIKCSISGQNDYINELFGTNFEE